MECIDIDDTDGGVCLYLTKEEAIKLRTLMYFNATIPIALANTEKNMDWSYVSKFMNNLQILLAKKNIDQNFSIFNI